jgi:hypothetical protein
MNSFAFDKMVGFFWMNTDGAILVWERQASVVGVLAPPSAVATFGNPSNAAYYKSAYWFIIVTNNPPVKATSIIISRVAYDPPTAFGALPTLTSVTNYTINIQTAGSDPFEINNGYGDMAFTSSEAGGSMYLVTNIDNSSAFLTAPLLVVKNVDAAIASGQPWVAKPVRESGLPSLQISFDCTKSELWATNYETREWGTLSTATGALSIQFTGPVALREGAGRQTIDIYNDITRKIQGGGNLQNAV